MCTLAVGAIAAFFSLVVGTRPSWLVLLLAIPLTVVLKLCGCLQTRWAAIVAAAAIVLAGCYAACLTAIARLAAATGFSFGAAFRTGGIGLTVQAARLGLDVVSILIYAVAVVLAAVVAAWLARKASAADRRG